MSEKPRLHCMRAADMHRIHPQTTFEFSCDHCGEKLGIYPSGQAKIKEYGRAGIDLMCNVCVFSGAEVLIIEGPSAEHLREMGESLDVPEKPQ